MRTRSPSPDGSPEPSTAQASALRWAAPIGACGLALAGLLPWTESGEVARNAYATVLSARSILDEGPLRALAGAYLFVPALAFGSVLATILARPVLAAVLALVTALVAMALVFGVAVSSMAVPGGIAASAVIVVATILSVMADAIAQVARTRDPGEAGGR